MSHILKKNSRSAKDLEKVELSNLEHKLKLKSVLKIKSEVSLEEMNHLKSN